MTYHWVTHDDTQAVATAVTAMAVFTASMVLESARPLRSHGASAPCATYSSLGLLSGEACSCRSALLVPHPTFFEDMFGNTPMEDA
jgi:hypothetical protein